MDLKSLQVIGYSDSSFASNSDLMSQVCYGCFIRDASERAIQIRFKSYKARRVTRSAMAAELTGSDYLINFHDCG